MSKCKNLQTGNGLVLAFGLALCLTLGGCASTVKKVRDGYRIQLPREIAAKLPVDEISHLSFLDPERGVSTVEGRLKESKHGVWVFETTETLAFPPRKRTEIALSREGFDCNFGDPCSCFPPEFFEGAIGGAACICAATIYCLPGDPCQCV